MRLRTSLVRFLGILMALGLMVGMGPPVLAQGTPEASPAANGSGPSVGDAVVLFDTNGDELAQIAVTQIVDPYEDADDATRGFHWVAIEVVIMNTGESDFEPNTYDIQLVDDLGFATTPGYAPRDSEIADAQPELIGEAIPAGETVSGWLFYEVIDDATVTQIVNSQPYGEGNFTILANLGAEFPAEGSETTFYFSDATEAGTIALNEIIPAFEDVDSSIDVARGTTLVALDLTITNTSEDDLEPNTYGLLVVDEYGYSYSQTFIYREDAESGDYPDLLTDPIAPGDSVEGIVLFELPSDASVSYVVYSPDSGMLYILAQPGDGSVVSGETLTPVAPPTDDEPVDDTVEVSADCEGVSEWVAASNEALQPLIEELDFLYQDMADIPPDDLRDAADLVAEVRDDFADVDSPEAASGAQDALVAVLDEFEAGFDEVADRIEAGDDPEDIQADFADQEGDLAIALDEADVIIADLESACPDSNIDDLEF